MARGSLSMSRSSMEGTSYEAASESSAGNLGSNANSIAYLVYANRGDPYTAGYKVPTTRDIPQVKLPRVDHTKDADLSSYVSQLRKFEEAQSNEDLAHHGENASANGGNDNGTGITPLTAIPDPFFSEDFQLDNPRVYDTVIGEEDSNMIQEKLSWYIDIIEAHLAREIARASTQFFAATAKFGAIEEQAAQTCNRIAEFSQYAENQQKVVEHHLETAKLQEKLRDATKLCDNLKVLADLKTVVESLEKIVDELSGSAGGISKLAESVKYMDEAKTRAQNDSIDLSRVAASHPLLERLAIAENRLKSSVAGVYVRAMLDDLRATELKVNNNTVVMAHAQSQEIAEQQVDAQNRASESLEIATQLDARKLALAQYRVEVDREVKQIIRRNVPSTATPANEQQHTEETQQALARSLHSLSSEAADEMCTKLFAQLSTFFIALKEQQIPDIGSEVLDGAVRSADSRMARVLRVRKDLATTLTPDNFVAFYAKVTEFCDTCLAVTDMTTEAVELQEFMVAQTKLYIHSMHALIDTQLTSALDSDDWRRAEVTPAAQRAVDIIASMDAIDPSSWDLDSTEQQNQDDEEETNQNKQRIELASQTFVVSKSTIQILVDLISYLRLANSLPPQHNINLSYQLIDLLNLFNHKTHHLILGFGATKSAGLKHISVKNLVLCFESLRLLETLQSYIKKFIERHLPPKSDVESLISSSLTSGTAATNNEKPHSASSEIMSNFDSVQQAYFDHRSEIHRKLVKLMSDKVAVYSRQIGLTDWSQLPPQANKYMLDLVRQTTTVAHIAQEMMPPNLSTKLVEEIFAAYKPKLLEAYANVQVETVQEKRSVLRDLKYFRSKSEQLKGSGNTGEVIYESVNGFVAPELTLEPEPANSGRPSMDLPRSGETGGAATAAARASLDEADTTIAYEPEPEPEAEAEAQAETANEGHDQVLTSSVLAKDVSPAVSEEPVQESAQKPVDEPAPEPGQEEPTSEPAPESEHEPELKTETQPTESTTETVEKRSQAAEDTSTKQEASQPETPEEDTPNKDTPELETSKSETPQVEKKTGEEKEQTILHSDEIEAPKESSQEPSKPESLPTDTFNVKVSQDNSDEKVSETPSEEDSNGHKNHAGSSEVDDQKASSPQETTTSEERSSVKPPNEHASEDKSEDKSEEKSKTNVDDSEHTNTTETTAQTESKSEVNTEHTADSPKEEEKPQSSASKQGLSKSQKKRASKKKNKKK